MGMSIDFKNHESKYFSRESTEKYLADIRHYKVPTAEEERELIIRYQHGDESAKIELVKRNQRFIFAMAKQFARNSDEICDYVNEGTIGLMHAFDQNFNIDRGVRFMTYAAWYIRRQMGEYLGRKDMIRQSNKPKIGNKAEIIRQKYYQETGSIPSDEEVVNLVEETYGMRLKTSDVIKMRVNSISEEIKDDYTLEDDSDYTKATASYNDYEDVMDKDDRKVYIDEILSTLDDKPRDKEIIKLIYGIDKDRPYTVTEVSDMLRMPNQQVSYIHNRALKFLQKKLGVVKK